MPLSYDTPLSSRHHQDKAHGFSKSAGHRSDASVSQQLPGIKGYLKKKTTQFFHNT